MKNVIISVESRKGGVGKTTAALCMAKTLLAKDYVVLLIDTDVTGTNVADGVDSPFWRDYLNILTTNEGAEKLNLLSIFEDKFMNGKSLPSFNSKHSKEKIQIHPQKINTIGSQIYDRDGTPICKPTILFDQLHGYWFVDCLKTLIEDFASAVADKPVAIVLDNSPGYVGLAPIIQDWLTDIGPEIGKFLMVTSLDRQGIKSSELATEALRNQYMKKWETSRLFLKAQNGSGDNLDYSSMKEDFFIKLTEHQERNNQLESGFSSSLSYYTKINKPHKINQLNKSFKISSEEPEPPEKHLGIIINMVPKSILSKNMAHMPYLHEMPTGLLYRLLGEQDSRNFSNRMVGYDPYIRYQFLPTEIISLEMPRRAHRKKALKNLEKLLTHKESLFREQGFLQVMNMPFPESFDLIHDQINQFQAVIDNAIAIIRSNGLGSFVDLIEENWQPKSIVEMVRTAFEKFLEDSAPHFFREIYGEELEDEIAINKKQIYLLQEISHQLEMPLFKADEYYELRTAMLFLISSLPFSLQKMSLRFFKNIIEAEIKLIQNIDYKSAIELPGILSSRIKEDDIAKNLLHELKFIEPFTFKNQEEIFDFFHAFTSAQARLMQLSEDSRFLIWLIQAMVQFEDRQKGVLPYVKEIADNVIIHKTLDHNRARKKSSKALFEAQYFVDFEKVTRDIVKQWEIER